MLIPVNCSNLSQLSSAYNTLASRTSAIMDKLDGEYTALLQNNPLYRKYKVSNLIWTIILSAGIIYALFFAGDTFKPGIDVISVILGVDNLSAEDNPFVKILRFLAVMFLIAQVRTAMRFFYSRKLEGQGKKANRIRRTAAERLNDLEKTGYLKTVMQAAANGEDLTAEQKPDLSDSIRQFRAENKRLQQSAFTTHKIVSAFFSALYYLAGFYIIWTQKDLLDGFSASSIFLLTVFAVYTYFTIDFVICTLGGYLGKFLKPFGCALCAAYAGFVYLLMREHFIWPVISWNGTTILPWLNTAVFTAATQLIAMLAGVLTSDYLGMRTKWLNGFNLAMRYGSNKQKDRGSVICRCVWSSFWVMAAWNASCPNEADVWLLLIAPLLWWRALPLLKPFGSTLYTFFGKAKCISITLMLFSLYLFRFLSKYPTITQETLVYLGIGLVVYLIIGGIVHHLNENTMFFEFMHPFI